ncbi:MAG: agglutinin biogenesis protein MshP [Pseudomonadota bacterium]
MKPGNERGFSMVTAIFLLVVLSGLGAMMMTFFTAQQQSSAIDVLDARAYQAARAGIEWSAFQITRSGVAGGTYATGCQTGPSPSVTSVPVPDRLSGFTVTVECTYTPPLSGTLSTDVYDIISKASGVNGAVPGGVDYVERVIPAAIWNLAGASGTVLLK